MQWKKWKMHQTQTKFIEFVDKLDIKTDLLEAILEGYFATNPINASSIQNRPLGDSIIKTSSGSGGGPDQPNSDNIMGGTKSHRSYAQETRDDDTKYKFPTLDISKKTRDSITKLVKKAKVPTDHTNYGLLTPKYHYSTSPGIGSQPFSMNSRMGF